MGTISRRYDKQAVSGEIVKDRGALSAKSLLLTRKVTPPWATKDSRRPSESHWVRATRASVAQLAN